MKNRGDAIIVILIVIVFMVVYFIKNFDAKEQSAALMQAPIPHFETENLLYPKQTFSDQVFYGHVSLFIVWGSWCPACRAENATLLKIKQNYHIPIYGLDMKDDPENARAFLSNAGNPFDSVGIDQDAAIAHSLGVYATPEIFLIDSKGVVRYIQLGTLDEEDWHSKFEPLVKQYSTP